ncbi:MAG: hypothetical protein WCP63_07930 [Cyanobium sp. ELA712]
MQTIPEPSSPDAAAELNPAAALRQRLTHGRGRLLVIIATTLVWVMDALLVHRIEAHQRVAHSFNPLLSSLERISMLALIIVTVGLAIALYRSRHQLLFVWSLSYLVISMVQVVANVMAMVMTSSAVQGGGLANLWDVAAVYMESVIVFMFIYIFLDVVTAGGAFVWPSRDGEAPPVPHLIDDLFISLNFISLNVNSTYGPTSEVSISKAAKLFMALQVLLAILMLTVLIARAVSA